MFEKTEFPGSGSGLGGTGPSGVNLEVPRGPLKQKKRKKFPEKPDFPDPDEPDPDVVLRERSGPKGLPVAKISDL